MRNWTSPELAHGHNAVQCGTKESTDPWGRCCLFHTDLFVGIGGNLNQNSDESVPAGKNGWRWWYVCLCMAHGGGCLFVVLRLFL